MFNRPVNTVGNTPQSPSLSICPSLFSISFLIYRLELLSTFLVLQLQDSVKPILSVGVDGVLVDLMSAVGQFCELHLDRGLDVFSISTPFFLHQFLNSWGKGIVSNVLGSEHCLLLIDLDLPPESEGAILLS